MQMQSGAFVVNEIESLEALVDAQGRKSEVVDSAVKLYMIAYWHRRIEADLQQAAFRRGFLWCIYI